MSALTEAQAWRMVAEYYTIVPLFFEVAFRHVLYELRRHEMIDERIYREMLERLRAHAATGHPDNGRADNNSRCLFCLWLAHEAEDE